jgi:hypothetical protein
MYFIKSMALVDVKTISDWRESAVGTVLQAQSPEGEPVIGMRCEANAGGTPNPCFLVLEGNDRGKLQGNPHIELAVLDISSLVHIRIPDPKPVLFGGAHYDAYGIVTQSAGNGQLYMRAYQTSNKSRAYVRLTDPVGQVETDAPLNMFALGLAEISATSPVR